MQARPRGGRVPLHYDDRGRAFPDDLLRFCDYDFGRAVKTNTTKKDFGKPKSFLCKNTSQFNLKREKKNLVLLYMLPHNHY